MTLDSSQLLSESKKEEFSGLYQEFIETYLPSKAGQQHIEFYIKGRDQAWQNLDQIHHAEQQGQDVTDAVLLKLLPHSNTKGNRERGAWVHIAPSITKDLKEWFQNAGWTRAEDWPKISQAILNFIRHCLSDPSQLPDACTDFSILPYSKGFQTGMLSPILNALRPDDFVLINNKSRQVVNYFAGTAYNLPLIEYAKTNATARSLIAELSNDLRKAGLPDVHDTDLFDMFSHWLVGVKKYFRKSILELAPPFSEMFAKSQEAEWAFDLLKETAERLGVQGPDDEIAAFTLRKRSGEYLLRMSFGNWLVLGFTGLNKSLKYIDVALFTQDADFKSSWSGKFKQSENERSVSLYSMPVESINSFEESLLPIFYETLDVISNRFKKWKRSNIRNRSNSEVAEAVFDLEKRIQLLSQGNTPDDPIGGDEIEETEIVGGENGNAESEPQYWKIAPEAGARLWSRWRDEGYISIGWHELGDLSGITRDEFDARRDELIALHSNWTEEGCEQVWKFSNIQKGDRIVANRGTSQVLGIGTVTGPYYFIEDVEHGHRIPVHWADTTLRIINEPGWRRTLIKMAKEKFERILGLPVGEVKSNPEYSLSDCAKDTGFEISIITSWVKAIERKGQAILYGPPGTGKTFMAELLAQHLISEGDGFVETVQFHPAYAYEDFIQGIRPRTRPDGGLEYPLVPGRFLKFCARASERSGRCVLIIDEINRANLSRVFGELMYLLEYRDKSISLAGGESFNIPSNVRLIGTMNTADRSIALVDHALRRRFAFLELYPEMDVLRQYHQQTGFPVNGLIDVLDRLNQRIDNPHYAVGISYFLRDDLPSQIEDIWKMEIEPYLNEYFFDHLDWAREFSWAKVKALILP